MARSLDIALLSSGESLEMVPQTCPEDRKFGSDIQPLDRISKRMRRALVYARVSSKEQAKEGFSIPAQLKLLRDDALSQDIRMST